MLLTLSGTEAVAHGGMAGLIVELVPVAVIVLLGIVVWRRSRHGGPGASAARDEAGVEE